MLIISAAVPEAFHQSKLLKKILSRAITLVMKVNIKRAETVVRGANVTVMVRPLHCPLTLNISRHNINTRLDGHLLPEHSKKMFFVTFPYLQTACVSLTFNKTKKNIILSRTSIYYLDQLSSL